MAEAFKFQARSWMLDVKERTGKLPDVPKAEFGGSRFFICPDQLSDEVGFLMTCPFNFCDNFLHRLESD